MTDPVFLGDDFILCDLSSPLFLHLIDDHQPAKPKRERAHGGQSCESGEEGGRRDHRS